MRARLVDQIVEILIDAIVEGRYPPGSSLPPERDLAAQLEVNRASLRQAISRLEQYGLLAPRQGSGTVVLDPADASDPAVLARLLRHVGADLLGDVLEVRGELAVVVARLAASRATPADVDALNDAVRLVAAAGDAAGRQLAELGWFVVLVGATHNRALGLLLRWVWRVYDESAAAFEGAFEPSGKVVAALDRVVEAVSSHNPGAAAAAMDDYASASGTRMAQSFEGGD